MPERYLALEVVDRPGLMWEWLRRDPQYRAWHKQQPQVRIESDGAFSRLWPAADAAAWGLHFRRGAGAGCPLRPPPLVACGRSNGDHGDAGCR
ncbi:transcriptional regulator domain-containing protein [Sphingomonas zeicaulis]|uniref:transcriptional regulator domain-containing protein n=1 Tax=Sphingomonas zeicaulis TaxID=1632740 RepID=UPI003D1BB8EA